jgi:hypothetical protein
VPASIRVSLISDSNVNDERDVQPEKEFFPTDSTEAGRQIDCSDEQRLSAPVSIRVSCALDSNVTDDSELHDEKPYAPTNSTKGGRHMPRKSHPNGRP